MFIKRFKFIKIKAIFILVLAIFIIVIVIGIIALNYWFRSQDKKILPVEKPQNEKIFKSESKIYRKKITFNLKNTEPLKDFQISLFLDTLSLIREGKLSIDCSNITFIDADKEIEIPYWIKGKCGSDNTEIWLRMLEILSNSEKTIYIYYGNKNKTPKSSFDEVFKTNNELLGWFYLDRFSLITDFSMNKNNASGYGFDELLAPSIVKFDCESENPPCLVFLDNWGKEWNWSDIHDAYFVIPSKKLNFDKLSQGSIELWVKPKNTKSGKYQRLIIDNKWDIELGIDPYGNLYFYPAQAPRDNYNLIYNPLKDNEWNQIIVTWNFENKNVSFYINGEKRENDIENIPNYWKRLARIGDLQIGGTDLNIESAFVGYLDGLRIYNKALNEKEVEFAYKYNSRNIRYILSSKYAKVYFGPEELVSLEKTDEIFKTSLFKNIPLSNEINITTCYAVPLDPIRYHDVYKHYTIDLYPPSEGLYKNPFNDEIFFLISKHGYKTVNNKETSIYVFGLPSHFFAYEGTYVNFQDSFLLTHVGLEISNPELIKHLAISFSRPISYEESELEIERSRHRYFEKINKYLKKIISSSYACGFLDYVYRSVGNSELSLIGLEEGIFWYKLEKPILVDKETTMMQLYYKPSGKEGIFTLKIKEMIFLNKNNEFVKANFSKDFKYPGPEERLPIKECISVGKYFAYLANEEKGFIGFNLNYDTQKLDLYFKNDGNDPIIIDDHSIWYIKNKTTKWEIENITIQNVSGNIIYKISIDEIKMQILGKKIEIDQKITIPLISLKDLQKNSSYYIILKIGKESISKRAFDKKRIIKWIWGNDPYYYPQHNFDNNLYLYRLSVDKNGNASLEEIR